MSESNDHTALLEAAAAVETQVTARAFIDAVYEAGINWHPDDPFTEIVTYETRAALFTEDQAAKLDAAASRAFTGHGSAGATVSGTTDMALSG